MGKHCLAITFLIVFNVLVCKGQYANHQKLVEDPYNFDLYWNRTDTDVYFELQVKETNGWFFFGFAMDDTLNEADIIISWMNSEKKFSFNEAYVHNGSPTIRTTKPVWQFTSGVNKNGFNIVRFSRKITVCESQGSKYIDIVGRTALCLYGFGSQAQLDTQNIINLYGSVFKYSSSVSLLGKLNEMIDYNKILDLKITEFKTNITVPSDSQTSYYCNMFRLPDEWMNKKRHLVKYETIFEPIENKAYSHHWILNECTREIESEYFSKNDQIPGDFCYKSENNKPNRWDDVGSSYCTRMSLLWQIGGDNVLEFPSNIAYPLGGDNADFKYFYLELHYNNPNYDKNIQLSTTVKFYTTEQYRPIEFGVLTVGSFFNWASLLLPPGVDKFQNDFYCRSDCVNKLFHDQVSQPYKENEINIFGSILHTHIKGKSATAKIIRDGKEIEYIYNNKYYHGNTQNYQYIKPITLKRGDQIKVSCNFSSKNYNKFTIGGLGVQEEMCSDFIMYYPRNPNMVRCRERLELDQWKLLLTQLNNTNEIMITKDELNSLNLGMLPRAIAEAKITTSFVNQIQNFFLNANRTHLCVEKNAKITYTQNVQPLKLMEINDTKTCPPKSNLFCFASTSLVETLNKGKIRISQLKEGDYVKTLDLSTNKPIFTKFVTYLHEDKEKIVEFIAINTNSGKLIKLTEMHLIARYKKEIDMVEYVFAKHLKVNDLVLSEGDYEEIKNIKLVKEKGIYAPLTESGNLLVDELLASCYANIEMHYLAHLAFKPYIYFKSIMEMFYGSMVDGQINWYAQLLIGLMPYSKYILN